MRRREALEETFWKRHSNPKSGWSRVLAMPALLAAVYYRNRRLGVAALLFTLVNPFLFSPPEDDSAWMTRVVLAERWWRKDDSKGFFDRSYPNLLNLLNIPVTVFAFLAACRQKPVQTVLAGVAAMALKFWYVAELVQRYDAAKLDSA
jgi:hypothetical protein